MVIGNQWHRWILICLIGIGTCVVASAQKVLEQPQLRIMPQKIQLDTTMKMRHEALPKEPMLNEPTPATKSTVKGAKPDSTALSVRGRRKTSSMTVAYKDTLQAEPTDSTIERYVYLLHADETRFNQLVNPDAQILVGDVVDRKSVV